MPEMPPENSGQWVFEMIQPTKAEDEIERKANQVKLSQLAKGK